ncbi:DDE-type integrase/transposase/recombinase [Paenibacillus alvei]|nr:DDE-type integrase/transposase/recombinase [Paenibacillus alvei]
MIRQGAREEIYEHRHGSDIIPSYDKFRFLVERVVPLSNKLFTNELDVGDLYNGEIVAYSIADRQDTSLVIDQIPVQPGVMLHSDQDSVYTSQAYQNAVKGRGITMSMSRKETPADNAPIESFHSTLKPSRLHYLL